MDRSLVRFSFPFTDSWLTLEWIRKHYIPLSSSYSELYNLLTFFSGFPVTPNSTTLLTKPYVAEELPLTANGEAWDNDEAGNDIAQAGRDWVKEYLRKEDMEVSDSFENSPSSQRLIQFLVLCLSIND